MNPTLRFQSLPHRNGGFTTVVMMIALSIALSAALYGTYDRVQSTAKLQDESVNRNGARAYAGEAVDSVASYLNTLYCGGPYAPCQNGTGTAIANLSPGTVLLSGPNYSASVLSNNFASGGYLEAKVTGTDGGSFFGSGSNVALDTYYSADTIYTYTPLNFAFLINGNQNLTGNVTINTGTSSLAVNGNLSIGGSASISAAQATGSISGTCTDGSASCVSNVATPFTSPTVDAYNLSGEANAVLSLSSTGTPQVTFQNNAALPGGTWPLTSSTALSALCSGGTTCITYSAGVWTVALTPAPGVLYFYGDLAVASGAEGTSKGTAVPAYNGLIATGNTTVATNNDLYAYGMMPNVCATAPVPTNVCPNGVGAAPTGPVANLALLAGGTVATPYAGMVSLPSVGSMTQGTPSTNQTPSGTVTGYQCTSDGMMTGSGGMCPSGSSTTNMITGGNITLQGNSCLTGVVAAGESLTATGTGIVTGMIDTADSNNLSSSALGNTSSTNSINGNLTINYDAGLGNQTNFGGGNTPMNAFRAHWQRYL